MARMAPPEGPLTNVVQVTDRELFISYFETETMLKLFSNFPSAFLRKSKQTFVSWPIAVESVGQ